MATLSSILAQLEDPGGLRSMGPQSRTRLSDEAAEQHTYSKSHSS